ncbi:hypothetical protein [Maribacter aurantiacus]|uniref:Chemotaxis methyl-accepting receptor HlyB-like 4HB MCP domain-containing protein n=1 Tax=Maribacter aurantiacus TaxID=1882343 RepID=A0A5R8M9I6_9FLAO|nr:hypothetical protein [Maribacter aurantiacus]TLF46234.1 hypothetical protein FEK29_00200 [Maribacter aurantiacus]
MFTRLTTSQRIQIGLILAMAFLLVLGSNRLDQRHFSTIQTTVNSVYKDRVLVQDFIYQLNNIFHRKELQLVQQKELMGNSSINKRVDGLLVDFGATELTTKESQLLDELNRQFESLKGLENRLRDAPEVSVADYRLQLANRLNAMGSTLDGLAQIQLNESGHLTSVSNKSLGMNILLSKLEVAFLIVIGLAMLALIFYPASKVQTVTENS